MNAEQIGIALEGYRNGRGWLVSCPCPNHGKGRGDRTPSLSIADGDDDRLLLRCFAGCNFLEVLDALKHRGIIVGSVSHSPPARSQPKAQDPNAEALTIWAAARPIQHTIVAEYLERRGIAMHPPSLRCRIDRPAMVAGVQRPDGKVVAIQLLKLTSTGDKAPVSQPRMTLGALGGGAVRFGPAAEVMGIAEGIETALSAMELSGVTVWASLGSARLHQVELPPEVKEVHIFVDNDEAGRLAAKRAADVHAKAGRRVYLRSPPDECGDWNDFLNLIANRDGRDPLPAQSAEDAA
jgi:putative DNA primase/helicase